MAKALVLADGDEKVAKAKYIKLRVENIQGEIQSHCKLIRELKVIRSQDMDHLSSALFEGDVSTLILPVESGVVCQRTGHLPHEIIDLIKMGVVVGIRHRGDWYVDAAFISDW